MVAEFIASGIKNAGKFIAFSRIEATLGFWGGILVFLCTLLFDSPSPTLSESAWHCFGMCSLVALWWATEPIPVTSLLPILLIPALGLANLNKATSPYANPTITISSSGLAGWLAQQMQLFAHLPLIVMISIVVLVILFLTEITSNTATAAAFLPLVGAIAVAQGVTPELYTIPAAIAASCAFMLPVATPPNAIVFSSNVIAIGAMIRAGFALNIISAVIIVGFTLTLVEVIF